MAGPDCSRASSPAVACALAARPCGLRTLADVAYGPFPENRLDIMRPRWGKRSPRPAVIVFHGGAWQRGDRQEMRERVCRRYLEQGFTVANVEYRHGHRVRGGGRGSRHRMVLQTCELLWGRSRQSSADRRVRRRSPGASGGLPGRRPGSRRVVNFYGIADVAGVVPASRPCARLCRPLSLLSPWNFRRSRGSGPGFLPCYRSTARRMILCGSVRAKKN